MAVQFGPISLLAVEFPDISKLQGELLQEIGNLSQAGIIRVIGLLAVAKDEKGEFVGLQATGLSEEDRMKLGAGIGALIGYGAAGEAGVQAGWEAGANAVAEKVAKHDFGLSKEQVRDIAMGHHPGHGGRPPAHRAPLGQELQGDRPANGRAGSRKRVHLP